MKTTTSEKLEAWREVSLVFSREGVNVEGDSGSALVFEEVEVTQSNI